MSIIGSSWKEESPSDDEIRKFKESTGEDFYGSKEELRKRVQQKKDCNFSSRKEISDLSDLEDELNDN